MSNSITLVFRPLERWPRDFTPAYLRKSRPFSTSLDKAVILLKRELSALGSSAAAVQTAHAERDFSATLGRPRNDKSPAHPGVIVAADTRHGALKWVCDDCVEWSDNLYAIVLTLERLRLADRYGVTKRGEQYSGWKMLPGPITLSGGASNGMSIDAAARLVSRVTERSAKSLLEHGAVWREAYREAAAKLHPDASGDPDKWLELQDAAKLLNGLHNR